MSETISAAERIQRFRTARAHWIDEPSAIPIRSYTLPQTIGSKARAERVYLTDDDLCDLLNGYALAAVRVAELEGERALIEQALDTLDCPTWSDVVHAIHIAQVRAEEAAAAPDRSDGSEQ